MNAYPISFSIYADSPEEAEQGRQAFIAFINKMRERNVAVRGSKIAEAVARLDHSPFIRNEIIRFLK
jgi:hypothetical protein